MLDDIQTYIITINGFVNQDDINAASPVNLNVDFATDRVTNLSVCTDQSGMIGILRHLHSMGYVLIFVQVNDTT
ncbi:MAG TPA: hypothetical protein VHO48_01685 [Anaerolineaceae bacterium]|nr:hypothetical protein [Anaerolineaceae bacterium]